MTGDLALAPLGLLVAVLGVWSLYNAWAHGRVRMRGWVERNEEPGFFWFVVVATGFATLWFGFIGLFITADALGVVG